MAGAAPLLYNLLAATAPNSNNPAAGARQVTPEEMLAQANNGLDPDEQYDSVDDYNKNATDNDNFKPIPNSPIYVDRNGKDVTKYATDTANYGTNRLMEQPNFWERFANPQGADEANRANQSYSSMYPLAQNESDINSGIAANKIAAIRKNGGYATPITSPDVSPLTAAYRTGNNPSDSAALNSNDAAAEQFLNEPYKAALAQTSNLSNAATQSLTASQLGNPRAAAISSGLGLKYDIGQTAGALERQPTEQKVLNADMLNRLHTVTGVDPIKIQLAQEQFQAEHNREGHYEELREKVLDNEQKEAAIQGSLSGGRLSDVGIEADNNRLRTLAERRSLMYQPTPLNKYSMTPGGERVLTPGYTNPTQVKMGGINDINKPITTGGGNVAPIPLRGGYGIRPSGGETDSAPSTQRQMRVAQDTNTSNIATPSQNNLQENVQSDIMNPPTITGKNNDSIPLSGESGASVDTSGNVYDENGDKITNKYQLDQLKYRIKEALDKKNQEDREEFYTNMLRNNPSGKTIASQNTLSFPSTQ